MKDIESEVYVSVDIQVGELGIPVVLNLLKVMNLLCEQRVDLQEHCKIIKVIVTLIKQGMHLDYKIMENVHLSIELQDFTVDNLNFIYDLQDVRTVGYNVDLVVAVVIQVDL